MEAMEVDLPAAAPGPGSSSSSSSSQPPAAVGTVQLVISDSGSSTEVEEEEDGGQAAARVPPRPPPTWAFSQRAVSGGSGSVVNSAGADGPIRRRIRQGLRVHYPSQTAAPSRGFPDFLLRAPAASVAQPESGSTTEVSDSDDEEVQDGGGAGDRGGAGDGGPPAVAADPPPPASPRIGDSVQQDAGPSVADSSEAPNPAAQSHPELSKSSSTHGEEGEGDTCSICFEAWTTAGQHRLSALRCGHLFGYTCIVRWLKAQGTAAKCPQCNKKAKRSDVVLLYAPRLKALDNSEQESLKRSLETEHTLRMKAELESAEYKQKLQVVTCKYSQVQKELQELRAQMAHRNSLPSSSSSASSCSSSLLASTSTSSASSIHLTASQQADGSRSAQYQFSKGLLVSVNGGSRVLSYCEPLSCLLASQPSPQPTLVPGWGVKKVSVLNMKASQYVPIHSKQIRSLSFNQQNDSLMLSAALDGTIKLTSLLTNTVVQTYNTDKPVWSCCWCLDNSNYVYAGLVNGSVLVYDTRDTSMHVQELKPLRSSYPVVSLCYVPRAASSSFPCGGLIAGSLDGGCFWEQMGEGVTYRPHLLPRETAGCIDIQVEAESRHCLVTYRPGRANPNLRCALMALTRAPQLDSEQSPSCSCSTVQTFSAGSSCKLLTKSAVFKSPGGGGTLVCTGDEASNSTWVWDAGSGSIFQKLPSDTPVLDISPFSVNGEHFLASLTEKMLKLYRWELTGADAQ